MTEVSATTGADGTDSAPPDRLDSWKDVAAYLKRDVSTVQRWERREGLPVHRHIHDRLGSVYAFRSELDVWQRARSMRARTQKSEDTTLPATPRVGRWRLAPFVAAVMLIAAAGAWTMYLSQTSGPGATFAPPIRSVVVLPLANLSGDPGQDHLAAGLTEELIGTLAQLQSLRVVSRTTAVTFQARRASAPEIARELDVDAVLEGSVRREGERVRIAIQLIHGPTDTHLWARDFERDSGSLLALQADVARAVADEIRVQTTAEERTRLVSAPAVNRAAYEEYLLGRHLLWRLIEEDRVRAIAHFTRAIELAPEFGAAYAGLAHAWWMRGVLGPLSLGEVAGPARAAAEAALARDARLPEAYAAKAYVQGVFDWQWADAEATVRQGLAIQRNSVELRYVYAVLLMALGRLDESVVEIEEAARLDPLSATVHSTYGRILYRARRFDEAEWQLLRAVELEPRHYVSFARLGDLYTARGRYEEALAAFARARAIRGGPSERDPGLASAYARMGRTAEARRAAPVPTPAVYAALGDNDSAFDLLFRSVAQRADWPIFIRRDPAYDSLRTDPRWNDLLGRMNLPLD